MNDEEKMLLLFFLLDKYGKSKRVGWGFLMLLVKKRDG